MNRFILLPIVGLMALPLNAQNLTDAVRFGSTDITGTARYRSMAGAFGALGADPTSMTDNPAGMGVYRGTSEISFTPNLSFNKTEVKGSATTEWKKADCSVSNLAYIISFRTQQCDHLVNFNIGVGFNHSEGMNRKYKMTLDAPNSTFGQYLANRANNSLMMAGQYNNPSYLENAWNDGAFPLTAVEAYDCYAIDDAVDAGGNAVGGVQSYDEANGFEGFQRLAVTEKTRNDEYNLNFSGNWDDVVYGGFTLTINDMNSIIESDMNEDYSWDYSGDYTQYINGLETKATGIGLKLGIIVKPVYFWRLGFAAHTPTWYRMQDFYYGKMTTNDKRVENYSGGEVFSYKYRYQSPWQMQISSAWVIGKKGIVSVEADMKDFETHRFKASNGEWKTDNPYADLNSAIKDYNTMQFTYKLGGEYRLTDAFSVRAGMAYRTSPYKKTLYDHPEYFRTWQNGDYIGDDNTLIFDSSTKPNYSLLGAQEYYTAGFGWTGDWWHIDLACMGHIRHEKIAAYPTTSALDYDPIGDELFFTNDPAVGATSATHCKMKSRTLAWDLTIGLKF
ncbi:MAG: hypothetical protein J6W69_04510 [Bacteroidales bacterium]|nr:hypothetical protein [Bacteroidales bacterium]